MSLGTSFATWVCYRFVCILRELSSLSPEVVDCGADKKGNCFSQQTESPSPGLRDVLSVSFCFSTSKPSVYLVRVQPEPSLNCQDIVDSHCHYGGSGWTWVPFPAPTLGSS